jgi:hypothetical protein
MSAELIKHMAFHAACAAVFIFVLNFYILKTELQSAVFWAIGFGVMAAGWRISNSRFRV